MGSYSGSCEIVEAGEELKPVQRSRRTYRPHIGLGIGEKDQKPPVQKLGYKNSLENDINQLFEAINVKGPKGLSVSYQRGTSSSSLKKNALKKPIAAGMPHSPRIGGSEPLSLKQALRDLCISKASEMAAMKWLSMSISSPGASEAGRVKRSFNPVVADSGVPGNEHKGSMVEISFVPKDDKPTSSRMMTAPRQAPKNKLMSQSANSSPQFPRATMQISTGTSTSTQTDSSTSRKVGIQAPKAEMCRKEKHTSASSPSCSYADDNTLEPESTVPASTKVPKRSPVPKSGRKGRLHAVPSSSLTNDNKASRTTRNVPRVAKTSVRNKSSVKKKTKQDSSSAANTSKEVNSHLDSNTSQLICQRCQCSMKTSSNETNQDSIKSQSAGIIAEVSSSHVSSDMHKPTLVENNSNRSQAAIPRAKNSPKAREKGDISQSSSSLGDSSSTSISDDSNLSGSTCGNKPHMSKDMRWDAISHIRMQDGVLGLRHFNLLKKLGCGDIGTVYLAELIGTNCLFAIKVMDNEFLARRKKMPRAQTEREILRMLDHPFLPTLYTQFISDNLSCLVMEYCPGGDLHVLRQKQPGRCFYEPAARFYVAEVLLALEYLHMLGVVYRDLKPENILVREDGHIMLTDFDLSLRCTVSPTLLKSSSYLDPARLSVQCTASSCVEPFCIEPTCHVPCFGPKFLPTSAKTKKKAKEDLAAKVQSLPQLVAEPTDARSNSFVGTHEYLAPEIIKGEGHGATIDQLRHWKTKTLLYITMPSSPSFTLVSRCTVSPDQKSDIKTLKLSVSDIPMLSCQYIQKGVLLTSPPYSFDDLVFFLKQSLSTTLSYFPPLAGRLTTDPDGHLHITCNDAGIDFLVVKSPNISIHNVLVPGDVPDCVKQFFTFDKTLSYSGHFKPLAAVQVTELADGVFIGCIVNHAVTDGTSFWHFFNTFAEITKGALKISKSPHFGRNTVFNSQAVLKFPPGGPTVTFASDEPLRERILHFSREAILKLKYRANYGCLLTKQTNSEVLGKLCNDSWKSVNVETNGKVRNSNDEISSFQSLCAQLWRSVTRARKLEPTKTTTFRMAVNCRHRLDPKLEPYYFGNAIQSIPTFASAGELLGKDLSWAADILHKNVVAHNNDTVRKGVADWEKQPRLFPLGNADGASITMGSSPRFPMYNNDFGWGRPLAVRSGRANKFDGKISAFPGRDGNGSVDLEVVLAPDTMLGVENDPEIMQYVSEFL